MEREQAIEELPEAHAAALRLRGRGLDDNAIAVVLSIPPEAVLPLLKVPTRSLPPYSADNRARWRHEDQTRACNSHTDDDPDRLRGVHVSKRGCDPAGLRARGTSPSDPRLL